jgi:FixJ family two-component response regulator
MMAGSLEPEVFIIEDELDARGLLLRLFKSVKMRATAYASAEEFLQAYQPDFYGCVISDVRMPGLTGMELHEALQARGCRLPLIITTAHGDVEMAVRAMKNGAFDFLQKPLNLQALLERVHQALDALEQQHYKNIELESLKSRLDNLTVREHDVLQQIIAGKASKIIALELGISEKTVETHRCRLMKKMAAKNLADLVRLGMQAQQKSQ